MVPLVMTHSQIETKTQTDIFSFHDFTSGDLGLEVLFLTGQVLWALPIWLCESESVQWDLKTDTRQPKPSRPPEKKDGFVEKNAATMLMHIMFVPANSSHRSQKDEACALRVGCSPSQTNVETPRIPLRLGSMHGGQLGKQFSGLRECTPLRKGLKGNKVRANWASFHGTSISTLPSPGVGPHQKRDPLLEPGNITRLPKKLGEISWQLCT